LIADSDQALQTEPPRESPRVALEESARAVETPSVAPSPTDEATRAVAARAPDPEIAEPLESERVAPESPREPAPPAVAKRPIVDVPPISSTLSPDSGLEIVETRFRPVSEPEPEPVPSGPRRVRPPRVTIPDEPLQIVETRKDAPPPG